MSILQVNTKTVSDLDELTTLDDTGYMLVHDGEGLKKITKTNVLSELSESLSDTDSDASNALSLANAMAYDNAGAHNAIYRGKSLGSSLSTTQASEISAGTFSDMYIGDYWTINSVNYRIAGFDYYYYCGDTSCTTHHITIVPDSCLISSVYMNEENTTEGGYVGSYMYTTLLPNALTTVESAFGSDHILSHRVYLVDGVTDGYASSGSWYDSQIELMNENMVYGAPIFMAMRNGSTSIYNYRVEKSQLPLFQHRHDFINRRASYWLRDVVSSTDFAHVGGTGSAAGSNASTTFGVRPAFSIC